MISDISKIDETDANRIQALKAVFPDMSDAEIHILLEGSETKGYPLGAVLFEEGASRNEFLIILGGEVDITKKVEGKEEHLIRCRRNEIIGEGVMFGLTIHETRGRAVLDTTVLVCDKDRIQSLEKTHPEIAIKFYKHIGRVPYRRLRGPSMNKTREDKDSLGIIEIPESAYYGAQTERAKRNFNITGIPIHHFPKLVISLAMIKKAAATANMRLGYLDPQIADAICKACDEIINNDPYLHRQFVVDVIQGGAGTSSNMNANEVIANRAQEYLGYPRGRIEVNGVVKKIVHPNDHVNMSQSTNDVYPTAIRIAILLSYPDLTKAIHSLACVLLKKAVEFADVVKMGRTQLQDAVPMTFEQEFEAFAVTIKEDIKLIQNTVELIKEINLGGTAIGTAIMAPPNYRKQVIKHLRQVSGIEDLKEADHPVEATWDTGVFVLFFGVLKRTATKLSKICNDLRLLSSGPRAGFGDIHLPDEQPGSSIMPGKVNPVIPEVVNQVAFQVIGNDLAVTFAAEAGQLQLNAMEPIIAFNVLQSMNMLIRGIDILAKHLDRGGVDGKGVVANKAHCRKHIEKSPGLATFLIQELGYENAVEIAKKSLSTGRSVREIVLGEKLMDEKRLDDLLKDEIMTGVWSKRRE